MKLQQNQSMRVFLDEDYQKVMETITNKYLSEIEESEPGYTILPFEVDVDIDNLNLNLTGRIEIDKVFDPGTYYIDATVDITSKYVVETYEITDADCEIVESDFDPNRIY